MTKKITRVVVVGGGFGGVKTALLLANKPGFSVNLISNNTHFEYHGALYRSAVGHSPLEVVIPLKDIFKDSSNIELTLDSVGYIDNSKKRIASTMGNIYPYDKVVLALGSEVNYYKIEGLRDHTETMHDIPSTIKLRSELVKLFKSNKKRSIRIAIIGAGPAGVELAGELQNFADKVSSKFNLPKLKVQTLLVESGERVLPRLNQKASQKATKKLIEIGVELHLHTSVNSCYKNTVCMSTGDLHADLIIWTAGTKPVDFYKNNASVFTLGKNGRVVVDDYLQAKQQKDIFVIGDNADTKFSGMAQTALNDASFVAKNLILQSKNKKLKIYKPKSPIYVVTIGSKWAVLQKGNKVYSGKRGWSARRQADLAIFKNFQPYKQAIKTWHKANKMANF